MVRKQAAPKQAAIGTNQVDVVYFGDNDALLERGHDALDAFAELALENSDLKLVLIARADKHERNPLVLSQQRAARIRESLVSRGVPAPRITVRAIGTSAPRSETNPNTVDDGAANRSVQLATE